MNDINKVIFWDFHDTLAYWPGMFRTSMVRVLDKYEKEHGFTAECFEPWLRSGFTWHEPEKDYRHLCEPDVWWENIYGVFEKAYLNNGLSSDKAVCYARETRAYLVAPEYYSLYEDTIPTLDCLKRKGYRNIILSNHLPELPKIAEALGLMDYIDICIVSALIGYEKPNPSIYRIALEAAGDPDEAWMAGDNLQADVRGAESCGINGILVRKPPTEEVKFFSPDLSGVITIIEKSAADRGIQKWQK